MLAAMLSQLTFYTRGTGKVNGAMWGSKIRQEPEQHGDLLVSMVLYLHSCSDSTNVSYNDISLVYLRATREKGFHGIRGDSSTDLNHSNSHSPLTVIKDLITAFSKAHYFALFIIISAINQGINGGFSVFYNATLGWESDTYSQIVGGPTILEFLGQFSVE